MARDPEQHPDVERYQALRRALTEVAVFRRGSLVRRFMPCGKPGCRCQARPPRLHGPYYQWTRKLRGKTVTVRVNQVQAVLIRRWIASGRQLDKLVRQMERISHRITERILRGASGS
jgi:hypothetical protein